MSTNPETPQINATNFPEIVFLNQDASMVFAEWAKINDNITVRFVSRDKFQGLKGDFFTKDENIGGHYILQLPTVLRVGELPAIIKRINTITFGELMPEYASTKELQNKIIIVFAGLSERLIVGNFGNYGQGIIKTAIKKYHSLYVQMFGVDEARKLTDKAYRDEVLRRTNGDTYRSIRESLIGIRTKEKVADLKSELDTVDTVMTQSLIAQFSESIFEHGIHTNLRMGLETMTQADLVRAKNEQARLEQQNQGNPRSEETVSIRSNLVDPRSRKLRDAIGIDHFKQKLAELRKAPFFNHIAIAQIEIKATNSILAALQQFPYTLSTDASTQTEKGYQPAEMVRSKQIFCVGFSLIGHALLSELGIQHQAITQPGHSALSVQINNTEYYFDGAMSGQMELIPMKWGATTGNGIYRSILNKDGSPIENARGYAGDPEPVLQAQMYGNMGKALYMQRNYARASIFFDQALRHNPNSANAHINKGSALFGLKEYAQAITSYDNAIRLDPKSADAHINKGSALSRIKQYQRGIACYNDALMLEPNNARAYINKGDTFSQLGNSSYNSLCQYVAGKLRGESPKLADFLYVNERILINKYLKNQNYNALHMHMLAIEKKEMRT